MIKIVNIDGCLENYETYPMEIIPQYDRISVKSSELTQTIIESDKKIAVVDCPYIQGPKLDLSHFDLVIVFSREWTGSHVNYEKQLQRHYSTDRLFFITGSAYSSDNHVMVPWMLFEITQPVNQEFRLVDRREPKSKIFDALLGREKFHRRFVFDQLVNSQLLDQSFVNITLSEKESSARIKNTIYRSNNLNEFELAETKRYVEQHDHFCSFGFKQDGLTGSFINRYANLIPWGIYENSSYTIVTETLYKSETFLKNIFFPTEKTAKPLYAKRPFVIFSNRHFLKNLKQLGFETFSSVIDESYDEVKHPLERFNLAFNQVRALASLNPADVYLRLGEILKHNHKHIINRAYFISPLRNKIIERINNL